MAHRPPLYRGPRGETLIPIEYAQALQDERDQLEARLRRTSQQLRMNPQDATEAQRLRSALEAVHRERDQLMRLVDELDRELQAARESSAPGLEDQLDQLRQDNRRLEQLLTAAREQADAAHSEATAAHAEADAAHAEVMAERQRRSQTPNLRVVSDSAERKEALYKDRAERLEADLANVRRHTETEVARARRDERIARLSGMAELHDALLRALQNAPETEGPWFDGTVALHKKATHELEKAGAVALGKAGEAFDPAIHEAIGATSVSEEQDGHIVHVEQLGWRLKDGGLVRPARVIVGRGG